MIGKRAFVEAIQAICKQKKDVPNHPLYLALVAVLEEAMECKKEAAGKTWIRWWIEKNNFGQKQLTVPLNNHNEEVETPEELYDLLVFKSKTSRK